MGNENVLDLARQRLADLAPPAKAGTACQSRLLEYKPSPAHAADPFAWLTCVLALEAVALGNFGIGAILVDDGGHVIVQGHNEILRPHFRSDRHAEMVVMDRWEDAGARQTGGTLYTSVEPCPMCLVRLSSSAVRQVTYLAPDLTGGMVRHRDNLPPYWVEMAQGKVFSQADCSVELIRTANEIFQLNLEELTAQLKVR